MRGAVHAAFEFRREAEEALQMRKDSACCHGRAIPLTPRPLSRVGARGAEIELDFNFFTAFAFKGGIPGSSFTTDQSTAEKR